MNPLIKVSLDDFGITEEEYERMNSGDLLILTNKYINDHIIEKPKLQFAQSILLKGKKNNAKKVTFSPNNYTYSPPEPLYREIKVDYQKKNYRLKL
jgi:hypothetical protein